MDGQRLIPKLGTVLFDVLADPRLGPAQRRELEAMLIESEEMEGQLDDETRGGYA